jgi:hypothetical protein
MHFDLEMLTLILIQEWYKWRRFDNETEELTDAKGREVLDRITNRGYMTGLRNARKNASEILVMTPRNERIW